MDKRARILIIDDDETMLELLQDILISEYIVDTASDPLQAVDLIGLRHPDLIIADLKMPVLNGVELIQAIRACSELDPIPIVAVSAYPNLAKLIRANQVQALIEKPFSITALSSLVAETLARYASHLQESS